MSRPRKPTKVLDAGGAFKKNPQRRRHGEPVVMDPIGSPPKLSNSALVCWNQIVAAVPLGVLTATDAIAVEIAAQLFAQFKASPVKFQTSRLSLLNKMGDTSRSAFPARRFTRTLK